ncbi:MAG: hypothetical protein ABJA02_02615 [Acidobacteriota bacterium]
MKLKCILLFVLLLVPASIGFAQKNRPNPLSGTFVSSRVVHRVKYNDQWWMVVYVTFKVKNGLSNPFKLYAYFYNDSDGKPLKAGKDVKYRTVGGFVSASSDFTPAYQDADYTEFKIYVPYEALNLDSTPGNLFNLKYFLSIYDDVGKAEVAKSGWYKFSLKY